jgi:hypothetical protein
MSTPEGRIKNKLDTMLKKEKIWFFSPQAGPYGDSGVHDRIACVYGLFVSIEAKADAKKKMTPKQILKATQVTKAGGVFFLVYDDASIERVRQFISNVRSYRTRQESNSGSDPRPGYYIEHYTHGKTGKGKLVCSAAPGGRGYSSEELRLLYPLADTVLL